MGPEGIQAGTASGSRERNPNKELICLGLVITGTISTFLPYSLYQSEP